MMDVPMFLRAAIVCSLRLRPLEFRRWQPPRQIPIVGDSLCGSHRDADLLGQAVVAKCCLILVARLMVAMLVVTVFLFLAPSLRAPHEIDAWLDREGGHARPREREMIGAEE